MPLRHRPIDRDFARHITVLRRAPFGHSQFVGPHQAGVRAAVLLSLIESARLNQHDIWAYPKDLFERLPTLKNRDLAQLLPNNWRAPTPVTATPIAAPETAAA